MRRSQRLGQRRTNLRIDVPEEYEHTGGIDLCFDRGLGIGKHWQETPSRRGQFSLHAAVGKP